MGLRGWLAARGCDRRCRLRRGGEVPVADHRARTALRRGRESTSTVWAPGTHALPPPAYAGRGRRPVRPLQDDAHRPIGVEELAIDLPADEWRRISWRQGTNEKLSGRFARVRVRSAHDRDVATETIAEQWLLIEWPEGEAKPTQYWLSTLKASITFTHLVSKAKLRWRIERDYLELKQEIGLGHFEGRGWRGFHHHATLCIAAYGFLVSERAAFSPSETIDAGLFEATGLPESYSPRGSARSDTAPRSRFTRDIAA